MLFGFGVLNIVNVVFAFGSALQVMVRISGKLTLASFVTLLSTSAFAQQAAGRVGSSPEDVKMWCAAGAGFAIGIGALGGTSGQGRAASFRTVLSTSVTRRST